MRVASSAPGIWERNHILHSWPTDEQEAQKYETPCLGGFYGVFHLRDCLIYPSKQMWPLHHHILRFYAVPPSQNKIRFHFCFSSFSNKFVLNFVYVRCHNQCQTEKQLNSFPYSCHLNWTKYLWFNFVSGSYLVQNETLFFLVFTKPLLRTWSWPRSILLQLCEGCRWRYKLAFDILLNFIVYLNTRES